MRVILLTFLWLCCETSFGQDLMQCASDNFEMVEGTPVKPEEGKCYLNATPICSLQGIPQWCCPPSSTCQDYGGTCCLNWLISYANCDYFFPDHCQNQPQCGCCISCEAPVCSECLENPLTSCRKTCRQDEYPTGDKCHSELCQCCKRCQPKPSCLDAGGYCVGHPSFCNNCTYASAEGCEGSCCYCCLPLE